MKLSKKFKRKIKKNILITLVCIALITSTLAILKLANISMPSNINSQETDNIQEISSTQTRLQNTDTITYIYDAQDLADFRDNVNAGDTYEGKTVYLMDDIDMSTVCSSSIGSWVSIGTSSSIFSGTFDGNYHTISNLYIYTVNDSKNRDGLFYSTKSITVIQNLILKNISLYRTSNSTSSSQCAGGIAGYNAGTIQNCGIESGSITVTKTATNTSTFAYTIVGGITSDNAGTIRNCYNKATVTGNASKSNSYNECSTGGITGGAAGYILNCYNTGTIIGTGYYVYIGGISGDPKSSGYIKNCYNVGSISASVGKTAYAGGVAGRNGVNTSNWKQISVSNSYCLTNTTYLYSSWYSTSWRSTANRVSSDTMKTYAVTLGSDYAYDVYNLNGGYPVLSWENERPVMSLNKNQVYIGIQEKLNLNVVQDDEITEIIGNNYGASNFKWTSTNESVAIVNENGVVTGVSDGYTTIYAYHEASGMYAMCVVNVSKGVANPQTETGNGFTAILKSNGTVWTLGNNANGQLGDGTSENSKIPVQVKLDEDTVLENIIKISVGTDHVLALTKNGNVYAWGLNANGQLGQNNTTSYNYAKIVLSEDGTSYLNNIVDISANGYGSVALDKNGNVYIWGNGSYGEIGNKATVSSNLPVKTTVENGIQVSIGDGNVGVLTSDGVVWSWGQNTSGQLGINCTKNTSYPMKASLNVTELSCGGYHTTVKKVDGSLYAVGAYSYGRLGTGSTANITKYATVNLPSTVTDTNKVKYIKSGIINTTLLLEDGTVWETGFNLQGELGNGTTTTATEFVQGLTASETPITDVLMIGKNNGNISGSTTTGYGLNTAVITSNGDIYTTGDNSYSQIGDNTTKNTSYYTRMGFAYLDYEDKIVEIDKDGYKIDLSKLKYVFSSINVYNNEQTYSVGEVKYTSLDETVATVDETGTVTAKEGVSGITKIKIEDITNNYETYLSIIVNKLENTDTVTYIYTAEDMVEFRDTVNAGDDYVGKTVYVMADIDMSTVCSATIGSWDSIGTETTKFGGTFEGNYHTISNLYINTTNASKNYDGLFYRITSTGIIQNVILENVSILRTSNSTTTTQTAGGIAGANYGVIQNCGIKSGTITVTKTAVNSGSFAYVVVGGITGENSGSIISCYNRATINGNARTNNYYNEVAVGGICGNHYKVIENCYNTGTVKGTGYYVYIAGIVGSVSGGNNNSGKYVKNCYNEGSISATVGKSSTLGGIVGRNGVNNSFWKAISISNSYCTTATSYLYNGYSTSTANRVSTDTLKTYTTKLGVAYEDDDFTINNGYPILWWEAPTLELTKKQEYIEAGETLQLNIIQNDSSTTILGDSINLSDFDWSSTNEDIAIVDENGLVTGLKDGYTTIYAKHKTVDVYAMCIINVAKEEANPQVESGDGFTAILKADGTVWTIGKNENGELGDGTNDDTIEAVQVKIDEDTYLSNIVKISVGTNHVLALTKDGKVYAWGENTYGQLGQNDKENSNYAKLVLGEGGSNYLDRIVDISAGSYGSSAVNQFGWTFVWGNGSYGEMGNGTTTTNTTPVKNTINTAISTSIGAGHGVALGQSGKVYAWGRNNVGQLGIGNTTNSTIAVKVQEEVTEISVAGYETVLKKVDGTVLGAGLNTNGQLANGTVTNKTTFTQMNLPSTVTDTNNVKYIKAGRTSSTILLEDGTVYTVGKNTNGELGILSNTDSTSFVKAQTKDGDLENTIFIGRSSAETTSSNITTVNENGRVYTSGSNTYGQIGDNTKDDSNYFKAMGYITIEYDETIKMYVGDTKELSLSYLEKYFNVYNEDITKFSLLENAKTLDSDVATYENGVITAKSVGNTTLIVKEDGTGTIIYIPVEVLPENGTVVPDVKTGENYTVTLKADGTVWTFGTNTNGELGLGNNVDKNSPKQVELLEDKVIKQISVGNSHVIALAEDGEVYTWGLNKNGQLGIGNTQNSNIPQKVELPESTELIQVVKDTVVKVIANKNTSYAITQDGKVYAWGEGYSSTPKLLEFKNLDGDKVEIIDASSSYALDINGNVYNLETRQRLGIVEKIKYISEGETHTVFLSENGTAYAIGSNTYGQFGDGTNVSNETEVVAVRNEDLTDILRNISKIEAGNGYTVAVLNDGTLLEWGINRNGQLGTDEIDERNLTIENDKITKLLSEKNESILLIDAGANHVGIGLTDGTVYTWGLGEDGEIGNGSNDDNIEPQLVGKNIIESNTNNLLLNENETFDIDSYISYFNLLKDINGVISYESKDETVITVNSTTGEAKAIKQGTTVIVAREIGTGKIAVIQVRVLPEGIKVEPQVSTNGSHTVTLKADGTVWCYGSNNNGELGNGTTNYSDEPVQAIFEEGTIITQISAGENFSVALDSEGNVWTWGANDYYQLGNTKSGYVTIPTKVEGISNITKISAGTYNCLVIDENKDVYGWGLNSNGELGIGSYTNKISTPTKAKYMTDVIDIAVGKNHSIALKTTGEVYVTGLNIYGQLGNNDNSIRKVNQFTKVESLSGIARITATDSGNIVSAVNGKVYAWGLNIYGELGLSNEGTRYILEPQQIPDIDNIVNVDGGKNNSVLLDKTGKIYCAGSNKYGQLGIGSTAENSGYTKIEELSNVMTISSGNTYTVIAKEDGTVWGFGDYNHGDTSLKSKTNSSTPMQVGNDSFGLGITQITIKKSETVNIASSMVYSFNLIYEDKNNKEEITYTSLNEDIAIVNEYGEVLGVREGFTWVKAIEEDGTEHVVYVYVTDNEAEYAPKVKAGEDFASVLKADGTVYTFGHNNNGELGIGSNKTKDIPEKTNVISSYKDISSGNSFTIALRNDGTVWSYGKNNYGQLGIGSTKNSLNPVQVNGISDIVQIATGKEHAVAIDSYGILYGWGRNSNGQLGDLSETVLVPTVIGYTEGTISSIWAGEDETIIINTKGKIYGYGSILKGELEGIDNAVKVAIGKGYMLILTTDGEVYKYNGSKLSLYTELEKIVDIDVTDSNIIAQTVDEKVYTWTVDSNPVLEDMENIYTIATGVNNSYVIKTDGTVYAKGQNQYGQLGNSTRDNSLEEFTLVGDREFTIEPESVIMYVNDIEKLTEEIIVNEFNVFNRSIKNAEEYTWISSDANIVKAEKGVLSAIAEGTAKITVTDNVTGEDIELTRVVIPVEKDRIELIKANDDAAVIKDEYKYYVEVETNEDKGTLEIYTKDKTDKISIDEGNNWYENGKLISEIELPDDENELKVIVETTNGTQIEYTLIVKKISTDVGLADITVDGIQATATSATNYEVVVPEDTTLSEVIARANSKKSKVSINGEGYLKWKSITTIEYKEGSPIIIPILVEAENGDEIEYSLTVYKESSVLKLESLTVDGKEAIRTSEGVYSTTIARNLNKVEVIAKAVSELVSVSINNNDKEVQVSTKQIEITDEITEVQIRLSTMVDGVEVYRDYILNIYKKAESGKLQFVIVNGTVVTPKVDGTYEIYLPAETANAEVKVIAQNEEDYVQIESNEKGKGMSTVKVDTPQDSNKYSIKVIDDEDNVESYILYIKKPSVDTSLKQITVSNGEYAVNATKSTDEENVYIAKVKSYDEYTINAITNNANAYVQIGGDTKIKNTASKVISKTDDYMEIAISVESENGDIEEYLLKIYVMSSDTNLESIEVNEIVAILQEDGTYLVNLESAETKVSVKAVTTNEEANVKIDDEEYENHKTTKEVDITSKDTTTYIYVKAEDGTIEKYTLVITGLPDDSTLQKIIVNGVEAQYSDSQNKYEIRSDSAEFNIEAIATDSLATVALNDEEDNIGSTTTTINKKSTSTIVKTKVVAQNGIDSSIYTLEIKEKSSDSSIGAVTVNGKVATKNSDGNYTASVSESTLNTTIKVEANDSFAIVYLDGNTQNKNNITVIEKITERETVYKIKVIAEDGTEEEHLLTVTRLSENTNIKELSVISTTETTDEESGDITINTNTKILTPDEDGNYYLKIDRIESVDIKAILEDSNASVKIKNSSYVLSENQVNVTTTAEKTVIVISVKSEDGSIVEHTVTLEKKSNDTSIKNIISNDILSQDNYTIYVDESLEQIDLTIITNDDLASIKLNSDVDYTLKQITRTIDLSDSAKSEEDMQDGWPVNVDVKAEDGTVENHIITILKTGNTNITKVQVNGEYIGNVDDTYTARVTVADTANVEIITQNEKAKIEIISQTENGEEITETVVATGIGTLNADVDLKEDPQKYIVRITSANGSSIKDYELILEQKSINTDISYVKVNNINAIQKADGSYMSTVSKNETYPLVIKLTDEKANVKIAYKDYVGELTQGKLTEIVPVEDGETLEVTVTVQAENGNEESYTIWITRISDNTGLEHVKVNGDIVTNFNVSTNTYTVIVDNTLVSTQIEVKSASETTKLTIGTVSNVETVNTTTSLDGAGTTKTIIIKAEAEDGTIEEYYINIVQLSASVTIDNITVNDINATKVGVTEYEVTISNKLEIAKIIAVATEETSKVSIAEDVANIASSTKTYNLNGCETIETKVTVTAEDGVSIQEYKLTIYVKESNAELEYVQVNGEDAVKSGNTYNITVDNTLETATINVKSVAEVSTLTIGTVTDTEKVSIETSLEGPGKTTKVVIEVEAEDGSKEEYILNIYQLSNDSSLDNITVNGETVVLNEKTGIYEIEITDKANIANVVAKATVGTSKVSIDDEVSNTESSTKTYNINGHQVIETKVTVVAEDGTTNEYKLKITVIETSNELEYVKVNTGVIDSEEDKITYKTFINYNAISVNIEIKAESKYANIEITNSNNLTLTNEKLESGILSFGVNTPDDVTTINYTVTSESGESKDYTIVLTKISIDNTLKELSVDGEIINVDDDGNYYVTLENAKEVLVKAVANNEYANIRINYESEEKQQTQTTINVQNNSTKVTITITSQAGVTKKYYLYIRVLANNTELDKVIVDSAEVTDYDEETKTYIAPVDNTKDTYEVFLMAVNDNAIVELYDGEQLITSGVGNLTDIITLENSEEEHDYVIKVSLDDEHYNNYTLKLLRISNDTSLKLVEVNDVVRTPTDTDKYVYEVGIPKLATTAKIRVETTNSYARIRIGDNDTVRGGETVIENINLQENRITVPVVVTAVDGTTIDTFNILLIRKSNTADLGSVVVNNTEVENVDNVYTYYMSPDEDIANVEISTNTDNVSKIEVDGNEGLGYLELSIPFDDDTIKIEKIIKVTSEDETVEEEYTLIILRETKIKGSIVTENLEEKHIATVSLYEEDELIKQVETNEDGSYEVQIDEIGEYQVVITKLGYLNYTVTNIEITPGDIIDLDEYKLIAGDVDETGEIEIDDLVALNDSFGVNITDDNKETESIYDFNEDGKIDTLDRAILKKNYSKIAESIVWVNSNVELSSSKDIKVASATISSVNSKGFIKPIACSYVISSEYGYRIHPTTGENKLHSGLDIVGTWHTEILAVADGEVTYAGVQSGYGNCVEIKHTVNGETVYTFYAHLSEIRVEVGDTVTQGQVIGLEGGAESDPNHGTSTGHHLHFEVRSASGSGHSLDPNDYIEF